MAVASRPRDHERGARPWISALRPARRRSLGLGVRLWSGRSNRRLMRGVRSAEFGHVELVGHPHRLADHGPGGIRRPCRRCSAPSFPARRTRTAIQKRPIAGRQASHPRRPEARGGTSRIALPIPSHPSRRRGNSASRLGARVQEPQSVVAEASASLAQGESIGLSRTERRLEERTAYGSTNTARKRAYVKMMGTARSSG